MRNTKIKKYKTNPHVIAYRKACRTGKVKIDDDVKALFRYLDQIKKEEPGNYFDNAMVEDFIEFAEEFYFKLLDWEKFAAAYYLAYRQENGFLRFNEFLILMGRGGGKTALGAVFAHFLSTKMNGIEKYHVDFVASSEEQAEEMFNEIHHVLETTIGDMPNSYKWSKTLITNKTTKSKLKFRTSNAKTKDGGKQGAVIFDEVHTFEDYASIKVFRSGLGKKPDARTLYITTNGDVRGSVLDDLIEMAQEVFKGTNPKNKFFPFICRLDHEDEVHDFSNWEKANPSITVLPILREEMETEYYKMAYHPPTKFEFMTKRMNMPFKNELNDVASWDNVLATNQFIPDLSNATAIGCIDYASFRDFCAVGLLFKKDEKYYFIGHGFITEHAMTQTKFNAPLEEWAKAGHITITNDETTKKERLLGWFDGMRMKYNINTVACDSYRSTVFKELFEENGYKIAHVRNGYVTHNKLAPHIETLFIEKRIVFGDNPFMRWCTANVYVDTDNKGNKSYRKKDSIKRKTDGFMAFVHGMAFEDELPKDVDIVDYDDFDW